MPIDYGQVYDVFNLNQLLIVYAVTAFDLYGSVFSLAIYKLVYHFGIGIMLHPRGLSVWQHGFAFFYGYDAANFVHCIGPYFFELGRHTLYRVCSASRRL